MTDQSEETAGRIRVLLVEDALDQALFVRSMLDPDVYEVTHAQDGLSGWQTFEGGDFELVVTDLNLPGLDGFDLTRRVKARRDPVPVLALTGFTSPGFAESAYRAGVDAVLRKPVEQTELLAEIRKLLPERVPEPDRPPSVFALGAQPGDVVQGCGATLAFHRAQGHEVMIFILASGAPGGGMDRSAARRAADRLGARVLIADPTDDEDDVTTRQMLLGRIVEEVAPDVAYIPSLADSDIRRKEAHRVGRAVLRDMRAILAYGTPSATLDFRPGFYKPIEQYLDAKLAALDALQGPDPDPGLTRTFARASAQYWGRMADFQLVEPFEVIRGEG
ncbi:MAG: response regulator [Gemmatimonadota bacterium]|jgi:CheY-like chemotaxis protein/LmbE family N-acetylglucosaminyl deacetylase